MVPFSTFRMASGQREWTKRALCNPLGSVDIR